MDYANWGQAALGCFFHAVKHTLKYIRELGEQLKHVACIEQKDFHDLLRFKLNVAMGG